MKPQAVEILGLELGTDLPSAFGQPLSNINMVGFEAAARTAERLFQRTGLGIKDVQVGIKE